jgi:hypothetical protein
MELMNRPVHFRFGVLFNEATRGGGDFFEKAFVNPRERVVSAARFNAKVLIWHSPPPPYPPVK